MRRFAVMGFTEAELGFVMAALLATTAVAALRDRDARVNGVSQELDLLKAERDRLRDELQRTKAELERTKAELERRRSTKVPQCWEKGERREPIATLTVLGNNLYDLEGHALTINDILGRLAPHIARGAALGCRYVVRALPRPGVDAIDQSAAVWKLRRYFDVDDRPH
jgi:hypothetical protein